MCQVAQHGLSLTACRHIASARFEKRADQVPRNRTYPAAGAARRRSTGCSLMGQLIERRKHPIANRQPPHGVVGPRHVEHAPREPDADETSRSGATGTRSRTAWTSTPDRRTSPPGRSSAAPSTATGSPSSTLSAIDRHRRHGQEQEAEEHHGAGQVDEAQAVVLGQRWPHFPASQMPIILEMPTSVSAVGATLEGMPRSAT